MKRVKLFVFLLFVLNVLATNEILADALKGTWQGTLTTPTGKLQIILNLSDKTGTMDVPEQSIKGLPLDALSMSDNILAFEVKQLGIIYKGALDSGELKGTFQQGPVFKADLNFLRQSEKQSQEIAKKQSRPQTPSGPFPYVVEEVSIDNGDITLSGTITKPAKTGKYPAAIMITGSGPQDRDETILGHKPFAVIADYLTKRGMLVLRFDDRGIGKSTGQFKGATIQDFATDVQAAFDHLARRSDVITGKIGLIGHSEGGVVAPLVGAKNKQVAFIVSLAGIGTSPKELYATQQRDILLLNGAQNGDLIYDTFMIAIDHVVTGKEPAMVSQLLQKQLSYPVETAEFVSRFMSDPWFISLMNYDNNSVISQLAMPVLAINGEKDIQVEPKANLEGFKRNLIKAGNKDYTIIEVPGLNHLFQPSETGNPLEYGNIPITFDEATLKTVGDWITKRVL